MRLVVTGRALQSVALQHPFLPSLLSSFNFQIPYFFFIIDWLMYSFRSILFNPSLSSPLCTLPELIFFSHPSPLTLFSLTLLEKGRRRLGEKP